MSRDDGLAAERTVIAGERTALSVLGGVVVVVKLHAADLSPAAGALLACATMAALLTLAMSATRGSVGRGFRTAALTLGVTAVGVAAFVVGA